MRKQFKKGAGNRIDVKLLFDTKRLAVVFKVRSKDCDVAVYGNRRNVDVLIASLKLKTGAYDGDVFKANKIKITASQREFVVACVNVVCKLDKK